VFIREKKESPDLILINKLVKVAKNQTCWDLPTNGAIICTHHWLEQLRGSTTLARFNQISWHWPGVENCHQAVLDSTSTTRAWCHASMMAIDHNRRMHRTVLGSTTYGKL